MAALNPDSFRRYALSGNQLVEPGSLTASIDFGEAEWIAPVEETIPEAGTRPAYEFIQRFTFEDAESAVLTVTAHGIYEAFLNGERVGDHELTPGFTSYRTRLYVQEFDVAALLRAGENELRFVVSDGWWRGRTGAHRVPDNFGMSIAVIARLVARQRGQESVLAMTGADWFYGIGPIVAADLMDGQTTDFNRVGVTAWRPVKLSEEGAAATHLLERSPAPPTRRVREYPPVKIVRLASGRQIVDFGTNLNGWVRLTKLGPIGRTTILSHGEALDAVGDLNTRAAELMVYPSEERLALGQIDKVISRGAAGDVFEPRHTTHGFRYVAIDGCDEDLTPSDITAILVRSDLTETGTFWSDNADINRLHEITVQSWLSNSCDIPTDCPQRQRFGYTGDFQIFADAAAYLDDISGFGRKWLQSLADDQHANGCVTNVAPDCAPAPGSPEGAFDGSAGWGDAATIVPWALYNAYGDKELLRTFLPMMRGWVNWAAPQPATGRHPRRVAMFGAPAPHEQFLWDSGFHWGEWSEPDEGPLDFTADRGIIATAYLARSSEIVMLAARELAEDTIAETYRELHEKVRTAWQKEFITSNGLLETERQAHYVRALAFGLVPDALRERFAEHLVTLIRKAGDHLNTGFLSTGMLLPVLADHGHLDVAYSLLTQRSAPSWFYMLDHGATTIWENWETILENRLTPDELAREDGSQVHYSKGAVVTFLHRYVAGILPHQDAPAYSRFTIRVRPNQHVGAAEGTLHTPHGLIRSAWHREGDELVLRATVPAGTEATIDLPGQEPHTVGAGDHRFVALVPATTQGADSRRKL